MRVQNPLPPDKSIKPQLAGVGKLANRVCTHIQIQRHWAGVDKLTGRAFTELQAGMMVEEPIAVPGLFYRREDGVEVPIGDKDNDVFVAVMNPEGTCTIERYYMNEFDAFYAPVSREVASIYMHSLISGFEPPRRLDHLDKPARQTLPGKYEVPGVSLDKRSGR